MQVDASPPFIASQQGVVVSKNLGRGRSSGARKLLLLLLLPVAGLLLLVRHSTRASHEDGTTFPAPVPRSASSVDWRRSRPAGAGSRGASGGGGACTGASTAPAPPSAPSSPRAKWIRSLIIRTYKSGLVLFCRISLDLRTQKETFKVFLLYSLPPPPLLSPYGHSKQEGPFPICRCGHFNYN